MVVTPLMWKCLDRLASFHSFLWRNPIDWNPVTRKLVHHLISMKMLPWICALFLTTTLALLPTLVIAILELFGLITIPLTDLMVNLIILALAAYSVLGNISVALVSACVVEMFSVLRLYGAHLRLSKS